ncbi:MAG: polysaccharide deacetylase family protein [Clostridia bacterium]|nr:polysaccharide deacetylase family protein [Clostridia bacterium]
MKKFLSLAVVLAISLALVLRTGAFAGNVFCKNTGAGKKIALTFDDGPHPIYTPRILEILERYGVKATFFVIGKNVENYPEAAEALLESECEIGNHTYTHKNMAKMSDEELVDEIVKTERALSGLSDRELSLIRPPEGSCGVPLERVTLSKGYDIILWNIDTKDWAHTPSDKIADNVLSDVRGGDIILMHDYISGGSPTCDALEKMIPALIEQGYEFVTVSELIGDE